MAQSDTTLLEALNDCLVQVGERPVSALGNVVARKGVLALEQALENISLMNDWDFKKEWRTPLSWDGEVADLGNVERVFTAQYRTSTTTPYRPLQFVDLPTLYQTHVVGPGVPTHWAFSGDTEVVVLPYPDTVESQNNVRFYASYTLLPPTRPGDVFPLPERFMPLLKKQAMYHLAISHLDDMGLAQALANEVMVLQRRYVARETNREVGSLNLYRRRR